MPVAINSMVDSQPAPNFQAVEVITNGTKITIDGSDYLVLQVVTTFTETVTPFRVDVVTLTPPKETYIKDNSSSVLREGDEAEGNFGNKIVIQSGQTKLKCGAKP